MVSAIREAATTLDVSGEAFLIATASESTVSELTQRMIAAMLDEGMAELAVEFSATRTGDVARNYSDTQKARGHLGWEVRVRFDDGL